LLATAVEIAERPEPGEQAHLHIEDSEEVTLTVSMLSEFARVDFGALQTTLW